MTLFSGRRDLLDAFRRGDRPAMAEVYACYVDEVAALLRCGCRLSGGHTAPGVRDPARLCDLLQEVFLKAFAPGARRAYDGLRPYRPYLLRIARNVLVDHARSAGRLVPVDDPLEEVEPLPEPAAEESLEQRRLQEATREFCAAADLETREFIRLRFEEDLSQRDLAERLGVTRRHVRTLEDRVREELQRFLLRRERTRPGSAGGP